MAQPSLQMVARSPGPLTPISSLPHCGSHWWRTGGEGKGGGRRGAGKAINAGPSVSRVWVRTASGYETHLLEQRELHIRVGGRHRRTDGQRRRKCHVTKHGRRWDGFHPTGRHTPLWGLVLVPRVASRVLVTAAVVTEALTGCAQHCTDTGRVAVSRRSTLSPERPARVRCP